MILVLFFNSIHNDNLLLKFILQLLHLKIMLLPVTASDDFDTKKHKTPMLKLSE